MTDLTAPLHTAPVAPGDTGSGRQGELVGRFVLLSRLGEGGSGEVYSAFDPVLDRKVAIKLLRAQGRDQAQLVREGRFLARLSHPGVVAVHDAGVHDDRAFLAMELVEGETLTTWARARIAAKDLRSVLAALVHAGHGIAAAHDCELVHGDVKPSNVLVGRDGRARVSDFGIARSGGSAPRENDEDPHEPAVRARYAGTPTYMAPEQHDGELPDARSDQYGFCLMAWTVLTGVHPYAAVARQISSNADSPATQDGSAEPCALTPDGSNPLPEWLALADAQRSWRPQWSARSAMPRRVAEVLQRGLSPDPAMRWPSMRPLLAALDRDAASTRRRLVTGLGVGTLLLSAGVATAVLHDPRALCSGGEEQIATAWGPSQREAVADAFAHTDAEFARDAWARAEPLLQAYAQDWGLQHREACEATSVRGEQSEAVMDLRMTCLHDRRVALGAATDALADADRTTIVNAHRIIDGLAPLSRCADVQWLLSVVAVPDDPADAQRVTAARSQIEAARALLHAGHFSESLEQLDAVAESVADLDYEPLHAELQARRAAALSALEQSPEAEAAAAGALQSALQTQQWDVATDAAVLLTEVVGDSLAREPEGLAFATTALGLTRRAAAETGSHAAALHARAKVMHRAGHYPEAEAGYRAAIAQYDDSGRGRHEAVSTYHGSLAHALLDLSRYEESEAEARTALAIAEQALGPAHPGVAQSREYLANVLAHLDRVGEAQREQELAMRIRADALGETSAEMGRSKIAVAELMLRRGDAAAAQPMIEEAIATFEETLGPRHHGVATALNLLAVVHAEQGRIEDAEGTLRRALSIQTERYGPNHPEIATLRDNLGSMLLMGGHPEEAEAELRRALSIREATVGPISEDVMTSCNNLGATLLNRGQLDEAEQILGRALEISNTLFGASHPHTAGAHTALAIVSTRLGREVDALAHLEAAWLVRSRPDVPPDERGNTGRRLAETLVATGGDLDRAKAIAEIAAASYEIAGPAHADRAPAIRTWAADL